jgi:hypothetical protein
MSAETESIDRDPSTTIVKIGEDSDLIEALIELDTTMVDNIITVNIEEDK